MYMIVVSVKINDDDHVLWASCTINTKVITAVDEPLSLHPRCEEMSNRTIILHLTISPHSTSREEKQF